MPEMVESMVELKIMVPKSTKRKIRTIAILSKKSVKEVIEKMVDDFEEWADNKIEEMSDNPDQLFGE